MSKLGSEGASEAGFPPCAGEDVSDSGQQWLGEPELVPISPLKEQWGPCYQYKATSTRAKPPTINKAPNQRRVTTAETPPTTASKTPLPITIQP